MQGASQNPALAPGDRMPNFQMPDQEGTKRIFYLEVGDGPSLLLACRMSGDAGKAHLEALAGAVDSLAARNVACFVVTDASPENNNALAESLALPYYLFSDPNDTALAPLLGAADGAPVAAYLLDPNQRILAIFAAEAPKDMVPAVLGALDRDWPEGKEEADLCRYPAPVLCLPRVLEPAFCQRLIEAWQANHNEGGLSTGYENVVDQSKKKALEHLIHDPGLNEAISRRLSRRIGPELRKAFNFEKRFTFETHYILSYRPDRQDFFGLHRDNLRPSQPRRFAMSLNLNDDFEGGELRFPEYSPYLYKPPAGGAAVFSCNLLHEALPVTKGQRWTLVSFFCEMGQQGAAPNQRQQAGRASAAGSAT